MILRIVMAAFVYLQAVIQGKVLKAFACCKQQVTHALCVSGFVARRRSVLNYRHLQIFSNPNKVLPGLCQLWQEPQRQPLWSLLIHFQHAS